MRGNQAVVKPCCEFPSSGVSRLCPLWAYETNCWIRFIEDLEAEVERLEEEVRKMNEAGEPSSATRPESSIAGHAAYQTAGAQYPSRDDGFDWSIVGEAGAGSIHPRLGWGMNGMMQSAFSVDNSQPHVSGNPNPLFPLVRSSAGARHLSHPSMPLYLEAYLTQIHPAFPFWTKKPSVVA